MSTEQGEGGEKTVPWSRFEERGSRIKALEAELAAAKDERATFGQQAEAWKAGAAEAEKWKGEHAKLSATVAEERVFAAAGITDPEMQDAVRWAYGRLPAEGRGELREVVEGWKAKPDTAPSLLRQAFAPPAAPASPSAPTWPRDRGAPASPPGAQGGASAAAVLGGASDAAILARLGRKA